MSRNLARSTCCDNVLRLSDLRGKPIEFRRYHDSLPNIGTRWDCPDCHVPYFVIWRTVGDGALDPHDGAQFVLDLSHYWTFNDEPLCFPCRDTGWNDDLNAPCDDCKAMYQEPTPRSVCEDDADDRQWIW
jgi:hypothetical protein